MSYPPAGYLGPVYVPPGLPQPDSGSCRAHGCQLGKAEAVRAEAGRLLAELEAKMNDARWARSLWCEVGGHSFSEKDPGRRLLTQTIVGEDGQESVDTLTACGQCADPNKRRITNPFKRAALPGKAEDAVPGG